MGSIGQELCVLSPHRDDAVFSLGLALRTWYARGLALSIVTVYTRSIYAPRVLPDHSPRPSRPDREGLILLANVSALRAQEDHKAFRRIDAGVRRHDLHRFDAPVRLSWPSEKVCAPREHVADESEARQLTPEFREHLQRSLMLAPLGLGNHIDHATVRNAALNAAARSTTGAARLGFYEDLPYADWTPATTLKEYVVACETQLQTHLSPVIIRHRRALPTKRQLARTYSSQIDEEEAERIARFSLRYHGGERIWIPAHNRRWRVVS